MSLSHTAARGAAATFGGQWARFVLQIASVSILARLLSPDDYGRIAMVTAITGIAILLGDFGLSTASIQAKQISRGQRSNLFWINVGVGLVCFGIVCAAARPIAAFYDDRLLSGVAVAVGIVFLTEAAGSQFRAESARAFRFGWLAVADVSSQAVGLVAAVISVYVGAGFWALVVQQIAVSAWKLVILLFASPWRPGLPRRRENMKGLLTFGVNTLGVQAVNYFSANADTVMIGKYLGSGPLGVYSRAFQLFRLPLQQIASPMTRVALPVLSRVEDAATFLRYVLRGQKVLSYVFGGSFLVGVAVSTPLIDVLLGDRWHGSARVFLILCVGGIFQAFGYVYQWVLLAKALTGLQLGYSIATRIFMVLLMLGGLYWGINGVALGSTVGLAVNWLVLTLFAIPKAGLPVGPVVRTALTPMLYFVPMVAIVYSLCWALTPRIGSLATLGVALVVIAAFFGLLYLVVPGFRNDVRQILDTVKRVRRGDVRRKPAPAATAPAPGGDAAVPATTPGAHRADGAARAAMLAAETTDDPDPDVVFAAVDEALEADALEADGGSRR